MQTLCYDEIAKQNENEINQTNKNIIRQEEFVSLRYSWLRDGVDVLVVCFSRADVQSFYMFQEQLIVAKRLLQQVPKPRKIPMVAVGTKSDESAAYEVVIQINKQTNKQIKSMEDVTEVINAHGGPKYCRYVECSAFTGDNVNSVFETVVSMYREWREHGGNEVQSNDQNGQASKPIAAFVNGNANSNSSSSSSSDPDKIEVVYSRLEDGLASALPIEVELQTMVNLSYPSNRRSTVQEQVTTNCMSWLISTTFCCPNFSQYLSMDEPRRLKFIGRVPRDKFPNDIAPPVFCARHFQVRRVFHLDKFIYVLITAILFPFALTVQTLMFLFYSPTW
ncbi:hypothetical protein RFI_23305 [Reticulomyxa filosa]|uniref:Uncharacterized protein n=1 Tax=Reticulomyxa filosa TaxID=46433 RepID=X6MJ68_RETFI|nr:hypothetical protein RFI_23305 [Reticulomyxa filosa]|eukprot:ETO14063.1 hypothetical protein RFI_23305 [Reticulomyxa filosa]